MDPASAGYDASKLEVLRQHLRDSGASSMLLLHQGRILFSFGDVEQRVLVHSIRKSLVHSLIGIGQARGCIDLSRTLAQLEINDSPEPLSDAEREATLTDVLKSRSGVYHNAAAENEAMTQDRPPRGSHQPGEHFYYNNWDFNVAGAIYEQQCGGSVFADFERYIAKPLGMRFRADVQRLDASDVERAVPDIDGFYQYEPSRSRFPAYHFRLSALDLALYGQLYLQRGKWRSEQIVPSQWIDLGTQPYSITDKNYGLAYGMLWGVVVPEPEPTAPPAFFHTGNGVHMLGVYPRQQLVFVLRVDTEKPFTFHGGHLYRAIQLAHGARLPTTASP